MPDPDLDPSPGDRNQATDPEHDGPSRGPIALIKQLRSEGFTAIDASEHEPLGQVGAGRQPHGLVVDPSGRFGYVPYAGSNEVEVIDLDALAVADRTDRVGAAPVGAALTRTGRYLLVSTYGDLPESGRPGIAVVRADSDTIGYVDELPVGKAAGIVVGPRNDCWIALRERDEVVRIAGSPPFSELSRIEVPESPQDLAYASDYGLLAVNCVDGDAVTFVDALSADVVGSVPAPNPRDGTAVPACGRWFVGDTDGDGMTAIDLGAIRSGPTDERVAEHVPLGTATAFSDVTPDGTLLAVDAYEDDRVTFLDPAALDAVARIDVGPTPRHPRFSPDGRTCYVQSVDGDTVTVIDVTAVRTGGQDPIAATIDLPEGAGPAGCFRTDRR